MQPDLSDDIQETNQAFARKNALVCTRKNEKNEVISCLKCLKSPKFFKYRTNKPIHLLHI